MGLIGQAMCKHEDLIDEGKYRKLRCRICGKVLWVKE